MRETTAEWLAPMIEEAERAGVDPLPLLRRVIFPVEEATEELLPPTPIVSHLQETAESGGMRVAALDWVRFGQLLRDEIGWLDYPDVPALDGNPNN